jgi:ABC-type nitrate/sulfonate/bicarbonate transport system permease component
VTAAVTPRPARRAAGSIVPSIAGFGVLLAAWAVAAGLVMRSETALPAPWSVARAMVDDLAFYGPHVRQTLGEAAWGYLWGVLAALVVGVVFVLFGVVERVAVRLVVAVYCLPFVATAPILQLILGGDRAKIAVAAQAVFFTTVVGVVLGLRSSEQLLLDAVRVSGGGRLQQLVRVRVRSAVPSIFASLKVAAPAALLGAVIGEFIGGQRGIGVAMIASQQAFDVTRTWGLAILLTALSASAFVVTGWIGRRLAPWAATSTGVAEPDTTTVSSSVPRRVISAAGYLALSVGLILAVWWGAIRVFDLNSFFAKSPGDVWSFLTDPSEADARREVFRALGTTLRNATLGLAGGVSGAVVLAVAVAGNRVVQQAVMPVAIGVRSVPLVAMTPLVALVVGRGLLCVLLIAGMVTFFPTLVHVVDGLRNAPPLASDAVRSFGGGPVQQLFRVRLPYALPALFASIRIAGPQALIGATLAEWLATGQGIGSHMMVALALSRYTELWASIALLTAASLAVYGIASSVERTVIRRFHGRR